MSDPVVLAGVDKRFGAVQALSGANLTLRRGRVGAIVGENGAGKSTLAKIVAGILPRDAGEFLVDGAAVRGWSRRQAIAAGVGFVPQSLSFVATLSVVENHLLSGVGLPARPAQGPARSRSGDGADAGRPRPRRARRASEPAGGATRRNRRGAGGGRAHPAARRAHVFSRAAGDRPPDPYATPPRRPGRDRRSGDASHRRGDARLRRHHGAARRPRADARRDGGPRRRRRGPADGRGARPLRPGANLRRARSGAAEGRGRRRARRRQARARPRLVLDPAGRNPGGGRRLRRQPARPGRGRGGPAPARLRARGCGRRRRRRAIPRSRRKRASPTSRRSAPKRWSTISPSRKTRACCRLATRACAASGCAADPPNWRWAPGSSPPSTSGPPIPRFRRARCRAATSRSCWLGANSRATPA